MKAAPSSIPDASKPFGELSPFQQEQHCINLCLKKLDGDLLFSGCKPLTKLSDDEKRVIIVAFKQFTTSAVVRTFGELRNLGVLK